MNHGLFKIVLLLLLIGCQKPDKMVSSENKVAIAFGSDLYYYPEADSRLSYTEQQFLLADLNVLGDRHARNALDSILASKYPLFKKLRMNIVTKNESKTSKLKYFVNGFDVLHTGQKDSTELLLQTDSLNVLLVISMEEGDEFKAAIEVEKKSKTLHKKLKAEDDRSFEIRKSFPLSDFYEDSCFFRLCPDSLIVVKNEKQTDPI